MGTTKLSQKRYLTKLTEQVKSKLQDSNNVALYLPRLTEDEIVSLRQNFKSVRREVLGYVRFEI